MYDNLPDLKGLFILAGIGWAMAMLSILGLLAAATWFIIHHLRIV